MDLNRQIVENFIFRQFSNTITNYLRLFIQSYTRTGYVPFKQLFRHDGCIYLYKCYRKGYVIKAIQIKVHISKLLIDDALYLLYL